MLLFLLLLVRRSLSLSTHGTDLSPSPSVGLCFGRSGCVSVQKVYCGKTAEWIRMPFGVARGIGRGTGVLDGGGDRRRGEFGASH